MSEVEAEALEMPEDGEGEPPARRRRRWPMVLGAIAVVLAIALAVVWSQREDIARDLISARLREMNLPATYVIERIGIRREVVRNVVIGDPHDPDMTIERIDAQITTHWGIPKFGRIALIKPRMYGAYRNGKLSFGSLDAVLNRPSTGEPFRLPDYDLAIVDGRARIDGDLGPVGIKVEGIGALRDGFSGTVAAVAPQATIGPCGAERLTLYGKIEVASEKPHFVGPMRVGSLSCPQSGLQVAASAVQLDATIDQAFDGAEGKLGLAGGKLAFGGTAAQSAGGDVRFTFRKKALTAHYDLTARQVDARQVAMTALGATGTVRAVDNFRRIEVEGDATGAELRPGADLQTSLAKAEQNGRDTFVGALLARLRNGLAHEGSGSRLSASFIVRQTGAVSNIVVPSATVIGGSGQTVFALSRFQSTSGGGQVPAMTGNFATGGEGLPQIAGRMERQAGGQLVAHMTMADYAAGSARIAMPEFTLAQHGGTIDFNGSARVGGALPGGEVRNLVLPLEGGWTQAAGLQVWRHCVQVHFDALSFSNLALSQRGVLMCPAPGRAIVSSDSKGLRIAAGVPSLDLAGRLKQTPVRIRSGPLGFAWPGAFKASALNVELGAGTQLTRLRIGKLAGGFARTLSGTFSETEFYLPAAPLDVVAASGSWQYANGRLAVGKGDFRLEDRRMDDRFQPLVAHGATLVLAGNLVTANASLHEPRSGRKIVDVAIDHNLASGAGNAKLNVPGILFDKVLQPEMVSRLTLGVIAQASGTITGNGAIHWNAQGITSEGTFATDNLNFAAAFGPAKGLSGQIDFTDLINLVTAPDQKFHVASINPGIEVANGDVTLEMLPGNVLALKEATWPFMGGTMTLLPSRLTLGISEVRRYTLKIDGLDAARLVSQIDLANINATGTFDGSLPLVFDQDGGRIEGGVLIARPPGGNVSYLGALTYKDLSPMANFAFEALKSIDYREMKIDMNGALQGEIVTRVAFGGVSQGAGAKRSYITRQIAKLPIRFNLNVRAPFFQLVSSLKSLYDPAYVRDPRILGLVDANGKPLAPQPVIQPPVSETKP